MGLLSKSSGISISRGTMDNSIRWAKMNLPVSGCFGGQTTAYLKERQILKKKRRGAQPECFSINRPGDCYPAGATMNGSGRQRHRQRIDDLPSAIQYSIYHRLVVCAHRIKHRRNIQTQAVQAVVEKIEA
jgi:hypothetical protein